MRHSTILATAIAAATLVLLAACGGGAEGKQVVKVAWVLPADHPTSKALELFEARAEELSGGTVDVRLFPNGVLGNATESAESLRAGNLELAVLSAAPLSQFATEMNVLTMPFLFRDPAHQHAVVDSELGTKLGASLGPAGMRCLGYFDAGSRNMMTVGGAGGEAGGPPRQAHPGDVLQPDGRHPGRDGRVGAADGAG